MINLSSFILKLIVSLTWIHMRFNVHAKLDRDKLIPMHIHERMRVLGGEEEKKEQEEEFTVGVMIGLYR